MQPDLTAVSLFAGIEGIGLALDLADIRVVAAVEIDQECCGVIARHFPRTALFNDVTEVTGDQLRAAGFVPGRGILAGGFPCQDLSVAGRRAGLGGARSGLFWHIMRLADELRPRWVLLENVPGLLSAVCSCPGDGACVAGRRVVACGEWRGDRDTREWFPDVPHTVTGGACPGGCMAAHGGAMGTVLGALGERGYGFAYRVLDAQFFGVPQRRRRVFIAGCLGDRAAPVQVLLEPEGGEGDSAAGGEAWPGAAGAPGVGAVSALQGGGRRGYRVDAEGAAGGQLVTPVAWRGREGGSQLEAGQDGEPMFALRASKGGGTGGMPMVAHALTSEGADASEDGTGRGTPLVAVPMAFNPQTGGSKARLGYGELPTALQANQVTAVHVTDWQGGSNQDQIVGPGATSPTLAHSSATHSGHHEPKVLTASAVRRLTPLECERLQGFPDEWTRLRADGTEQSDSTRYRQLGNAVAVPVVAWITRRIAAAERALKAAA